MRVAPCPEGRRFGAVMTRATCLLWASATTVTALLSASPLDGRQAAPAGAPAPVSSHQLASATNNDVAAQRARLEKYCTTCHNSRTKAGGLALDDRDLAHVGTDAAVWE